MIEEKKLEMYKINAQILGDEEKQKSDEIEDSISTQEEIKLLNMLYEAAQQK